MDLHDSIQSRLDTLFRGFLHLIADHYNLNFEELCKFVESVDLKTGRVIKIYTCLHKMIRGKNKGMLCTSKALENGYCGKHQNSVPGSMRVLVKNKTIKPTKTQLQIIEWLNTAVPQEETVLKKRSKGLLHEETDMIFDEDYMVIGRVNNGNIVELGHFEVEICEKRGWKYDTNAVEEE